MKKNNNKKTASGSFKRNPKDKNRVDFSRPASADILSMIRSKQNDHTPFFQFEEDNDGEGPEFHNFEEVHMVVTSMGLYREIMEEIEHENDPKVLKAFFADRLGVILEGVPDGMASAIDCRIKGIEE